MRTVQLAILDESGNESSRIQGSFDEEAIRRLGEYLALVDRLMATTLLQKGMPTITRMIFGKQGINLFSLPYSDAELHELLHVLRPLILENERHSFSNTCALLSKAFSDKNLKQTMRGIRNVYDHGELSQFLQITVGNTKLFERSLLNTWLNATQYHTDSDKANAWAELQSSLTTENIRALLMAQVRSKVIAILDVACLAHLVVRDDAWPHGKAGNSAYAMQ
jgi:hypothetical protein